MQFPVQFPFRYVFSVMEKHKHSFINGEDANEGVHLLQTNIALIDIHVTAS
jgi:hypothetical protein